jgi:hypothetical protein
MFNKKIKLFLITLILMLSVSAVAAAETNSSDDMAISDVEDEPPSGSVEVISNEEMTFDSGNASSQEVLSADSNDTSSQDVLSVNNDNVSSQDALSSNDDNAGEDTLSASKTTYSLTGKDLKMYYKNGSRYEVTLLMNSKPVKGQTVAIKVCGSTYKKVTNANGKASLAINLNSGKYDVSAFSCGITTVNKITVLAVVKANDVNAYYKSTSVFSAKFLDGKGAALKNANVEFIVDGKKRSARTNSNGVATLSISTLGIGTHTVYSVHPNGYKVKNRITVKSSIVSSPLSKHYKSTKKLAAKFYGNDNKLYAGKTVQFKFVNGKSYNKKTNSNGIAYLDINLNPGTYQIDIVNPSTGQKVRTTVKVYRTIYFDKEVSSLVGQVSYFKVTLYKNDKLVKGQSVYIYLNGHNFIRKTNDKGVASLKYKLAKGNHNLKIVDPYTDYSGSAVIHVYAPSIKAKDMTTRAGTNVKYSVTLLNQNGAVAKNTNMEIKVDNTVYKVKTNANGVATVGLKLNAGTHKVVSKDLRTGYTKTTKITALKGSKGMTYNKYGVSSDGKTLLAIGRPSAIGEESKYGYSFYQVEFLRVCPYCGSTHIYWSIFWAGDEHTDVGVFPATGNKEGSSAEGGIFCAECDCDWSIFGHNRGDSGGDLTPVSGVSSSTKADAYKLKDGSYVHP